MRSVSEEAATGVGRPAWMTVSCPEAYCTDMFVFGVGINLSVLIVVQFLAWCYVVHASIEVVEVFWRSSVLVELFLLGGER